MGSSSSGQRASDVGDGEGRRGDINGDRGVDEGSHGGVSDGRDGDGGRSRGGDAAGCAGDSRGGGCDDSCGGKGLVKLGQWLDQRHRNYVKLMHRMQNFVAQITFAEKEEREKRNKNNESSARIQSGIMEDN